MSTLLERSFNTLEQLAAHPEGQTVSMIAATLDMPLSATHRLLAELCRCGYVRQVREQGEYVLTIKLVSLGLGFLSASGVVDVAQPLLDSLAEESGELVRLAVVDGDDLTFVAKAQGARRGLRYDPDMGLSVRLSCSAAGHAWLSTMSDEEAMRLVTRQGFGLPKDFGPQGPHHRQGASGLCAGGTQAGLQHDQRSVRTADDGHGRAGDVAHGRDRRGHHRRTAGAPYRGAHGGVVGSFAAHG